MSSKHILTFLTAAVMAITSYAQPRAVFSTERQNMGVLLWKRYVGTSFTVTNLGSQPLTITKVEPDCECSVVEWPTHPIAPGQSELIKVTYNARQLGTFERAIGIITNEPSDSIHYVWLRGTVSTQMPLDTVRYANRIGHVRLDNEVLEFDDVNPNDKQQRVINLYNDGDEAVTPSLMHLPSYLTAAAIPQRLRPGEYGQLVVTLNGHELRQKGLTQTSVYLSQQPGDRVSNDNEISVSAILLPDFEAQPESLAANPPVLSISTQKLELEYPAPNKKVKGQVVITNTGRSPLKIQSLQVMHPCISAEISKATLKPGQSTKLKVTVDARFLKNSKSRRRILITTNDATHPKAFIDIVLTRTPKK